MPNTKKIAQTKKFLLFSKVSADYYASPGKIQSVVVLLSV